MSVITVERKESLGGSSSKHRSGFMTTTELAKLCGVSRFTIINWTKQGRIKATRTIGKHYRIPVSEGLSFLRTFGREHRLSSGEREKANQREVAAEGNGKCGNCLTDNDKSTRLKAKNKNVLYAFGYGIGRGVHVLKGRSKVK